MTAPAANGSPTGPALFAILVACVAAFAARPARGADAGGAGDAMARCLATSVTAAWTGLPVRTAAARLATLGGCAIVIDRRIDPDTPITLDVTDAPLAEVLATIAAAAAAETVAYAGHLRVVPRGGGAALRAADAARNAELRTVAPSARGALRAQAGWSWPDGAVPVDLVAAATADGRLSLAGIARLPHDHFPATTLPPLPLADRIDLVLAHFDRRVAWHSPAAGEGGDAYQIVPIPPVAASATPDATPTPTPPSARPAARPRPPADAAATYTLTVAAPLDELLGTLAKRFGLALDIDAAALRRRGVAAGEIVRLEIRDASRDRLLDAILAPRGLGWRIEGRTLTISAADP